MIVTERWKYILYEKFRPQLFDLENDPQEQNDLGRDDAHADVRAELHERLFRWLRTRPIRPTRTDAQMAGLTGKAKERGYFIGVW
jgi:arylsulfatase A-like enzyme